MHKPDRRHFLTAVMTACLFMYAARSTSQVIFLEGGYSEHCANAAWQSDRPEDTLVTGSRLGLSPVEVCTRAIIEEGDNRAANYNNRGVIHFASQDINAALVDFDAAIQLQEGQEQFHFNRGLALARLERWHESLVSFNRGIELAGDPPPETDTTRLAEIYYNRAVAHEETGDVRRAYFDYRRATELAPDWAAPREDLARFSVR